MNTRLTAVLVLIAAPVLAAERPDMLRFTNGDQLRGTFAGLRQGPVIQWRHDDLAAPAEFKTTSLHQLVLREGRPLSPLRTLSHVELANHDRFPGKIVALDDTKLTLETDYAGLIEIPRDHVSIMAPNPMGGRLHYHGPFAADEWEMISTAEEEEGTPAPDDEEAPSDEEEEKADEEPVKWIFTGSSWLWNGENPESALTRADALPERSVLRFELAWKNRLNLALALHADFKCPPAEDDEERKVRRAFNTMDPRSLARVFGTSHILQLYSNYLAHVTTRVDEDGEISVNRGVHGNHNMRLGDSGKARIELRTNRKTGECSLFIDDEFTAQWTAHHDGDAPDTPVFTHGGIGFIVMAKDSPVKISDIVITEWNGMPDAARSLQVEDFDIVLMNNGTDRYAGKVGGFGADGIVDFEGRHGNFRLPLDEIAEIRFASNGLAEIPETTGSSILVRMGPMGAISGAPVGGDRKSIELLNSSAGKIGLSLDPVTLIDFNPSHIAIDEWSHDF
ncbi:MAG TPA: hypothetical protein VLO11_04635 [Luteolibacter sp.]|nr:hypothetical protein [Luteolibacter sp.]